MKIEWASHFRQDGSRRTPPASTIHGWLAKMRGTLVGNEHLRSRGMDEMRRAAAIRGARKRYEQKKAGRDGTPTGGLLAIFGRTKKPPTRRLSRQATRPRPSHRPSHSSRQGSSQSVPSRRLNTTRKVSTQSTSRANTQKSPPSRPQLRSRQSSSRRAPNNRR